jgi:AcrR family transcriptional regulator
VNYPTPHSTSAGSRRLLDVGAPLPGTSEPAERADAARNRRLLLDAAQQLVREHGVDSLTMDALAKRAGVGKGTVFRRFGSRSGLMLALLDHSEQKYQESFIFGPPPLGPPEGELHRAAELGEAGDRYSGAPYGLLRAHVAMLLRQADVPGEVPLVADWLLAMLGAALVMHQMHVLGYTREQIGDNWEDVVRRVVTR